MQAYRNFTVLSFKISFVLFISFHLLSVLVLYRFGNIVASGYYCSVWCRAERQAEEEGKVNNSSKAAREKNISFSSIGKRRLGMPN